VNAQDLLTDKAPVSVIYQVDVPGKEGHVIQTMKDQGNTNHPLVKKPNVEVGRHMNALSVCENTTNLVLLYRSKMDDPQRFDFARKPKDIVGHLFRADNTTRIEIITSQHPSFRGKTEISSRRWLDALHPGTEYFGPVKTSDLQTNVKRMDSFLLRLVKPGQRSLLAKELTTGRLFVTYQAGQRVNWKRDHQEHTIQQVWPVENRVWLLLEGIDGPVDVADVTPVADSVPA
jgi:hypothetical protein